MGIVKRFFSLDCFLSGPTSIKESMNKILKRLKEELSEYQEGLEQFQECDVEQNDEYIIQGWCEALEFTIKLIESEGKWLLLKTFKKN